MALSGIASLPFVTQVHRFDEIDSTNTFARGLDAVPAGEIVVVIADRQSGGRGQRGNSFYSSVEGGLWLSAVVTLDSMENHFGVNQALALSACSALWSCCDLVCRV